MKIKEEKIPEYIIEGKDREVIPLLYQKVFPLVQKFVLRNSGRKEDASDVFQDALMVFYKQIISKSFDPKYKVYGYLYRLSINYWINKIKKDSKIQLYETIPDVYLDEVMTYPEQVKANNNENILKELFGAMGEKCVELLTYTVFQNLLMEDIMIRMGFTSLSAVKMQQLRCKKKLIEMIRNNPLLLKRIKNNE